MTNWDGSLADKLAPPYQESNPIMAEVYRGLERVNTSGIHPTQNTVLVLPSEVDEKFAGSSILKPVENRDKDKFAMQEGRIIECAPLAFNYSTVEEWTAGGTDQRPKVGQLVVFEKYAGLRRVGKDGKEYLLLNDKEIVATIEE